MTTSGTPAGWYPDPENPGQNRYWDGTAWAAPSSPPGGGHPLPPAPPSAGGGSGSGGKIALIVVGVLAVLGLIGAGVFAFAGGDGGGPEELEDDEFADRANEICSDLEDELDDLGNDAFDDLDDFEDPSDDDIERLEQFAADAEEASAEPFDELRDIAPEGEADEWVELVDEWESLYHDLFDAFAEGNVEPSRRLQNRFDDLVEELQDRDIDCLGSSSMTTATSVEPPEPDPVTTTTTTPSTTEPDDDELEHGPPSPPPAFDDPSLDALGEDCYQGDMDACDQLFFDSDFDTPEEDYGDTCGGRTEGGPSCLSVEDPILP